MPNSDIGQIGQIATTSYDVRENQQTFVATCHASDELIIAGGRLTRLFESWR